MIKEGIDKRKTSEHPVSTIKDLRIEKCILKMIISYSQKKPFIYYLFNSKLIYNAVQKVTPDSTKMRETRPRKTSLDQAYQK